MKKEIDYVLTSASCRECTGLIPRPPLNDYEQESYEEFFPYGIPPVIEKEDDQLSWHSCHKIV